MTKRRSTAEDLAKARVARLSGMGAGGLQAMSIGLVMGGCIAAGYLIGTWLDNRFETSFWVPAGVFLGMAAGFREMFRTLKRISALTKWPGASASSRDTNGQEEVSTPAESLHPVGSSRTSATPVEPAARKRLYQVPEPPLPSFEQDKNRSERGVSTTAQPLRVDQSANDAVRRDEAIGSDTLRELMGAEKYAELQAELKKLNENDSDEETGNTSLNNDCKQPQ
jgi:F0F1-type ATP synthase assembly protein I